MKNTPCSKFKRKIKKNYFVIQYCSMCVHMHAHMHAHMQTHQKGPFIWYNYITCIYCVITIITIYNCQLQFTQNKQINKVG